ncbi:MAG: DUF5647 family protein [Thermodesulfobacteriota bacterium]
MNIYERKNSIVGMESDLYMRQHQELNERIRLNAHMTLLPEGDKDFNEWSTNLPNRQAEKDQPIVCVTIKKLTPAHSRISELVLVTG